jgi:ribose/xylose/arabinose/galactoside ABC-type transport system permease subunit
MKSLGPLIGLAAVYIFFCFWAGEPFYPNFNRVTVLTQSVIVTAGALGMTLIIISGGIDLSAGSVITLSTVMIARLLDAGEDEWAKQNIQNAHPHEEPPRRGLGYSRFESQRGCEMACVHLLYSASDFELLRSSQARIGMGSKKVARTKIASPVSVILLLT